MQILDNQEEIVALKRQVHALMRHHRLLWSVLVGTAVLGLVVGANSMNSDSRVIQAQSIQLLDEKGQVRAEIAIDKEGSAGLYVRDEKGQVRASLTHDEDQSALFIRDETGQIRAGVAQFAHGGGGVTLHGPEGKGAAALYYKGKGSLTFYDKDGTVLAKLPKSDD